MNISANGIWTRVPSIVEPQFPMGRLQYSSGSAVNGDTQAIGLLLAAGFARIFAGSARALERMVARLHTQRIVSDLTALDPRTWNDIGLPPVPKGHASWALSKRDH